MEVDPYQSNPIGKPDACVVICEITAWTADKSSQRIIIFATNNTMTCVTTTMSERRDSFDPLSNGCFNEDIIFVLENVRWKSVESCLVVSIRKRADSFVLESALVSVGSDACFYTGIDIGLDWIALPDFSWEGRFIFVVITHRTSLGTVWIGLSFLIHLSRTTRTSGLWFVIGWASSSFLTIVRHIERFCLHHIACASPSWFVFSLRVFLIECMYIWWLRFSS